MIPAWRQAPWRGLGMGLALGLAVGLAAPGNLAERAPLLRLVALPWLLALAGWGGGLLLWRRRGRGGEAGGLLRACLRGLGDRRPLLALAGLLFLLAGLAAFLEGRARQELLGCAGRHLEEGRGLRGFKYPGDDWTRPPVWSGVVASLDLDAARDELLGGERFATRWLGHFTLAAPQRAELWVESDDGSLLLLDGRRVVENLGVHPPLRRGVRLRLAAGPHLVEVLHQQDRAGAVIRLGGSREILAGLRPLAAGLDRRELWLLDRRVAWWEARTGLALWAGSLLLALLLLPWPTPWPRRVSAWLGTRWPLLALLAGLGGVLALNLNDNPGLYADPAHFGLTAWDWLFKARVLYHWSSYAAQQAVIWPAYLLFQVLPVSVATLRLVPLGLNLLGLAFLGLAAQRIFGRRTALVALAVLGTAALVLFMARYCIELTSYLALLLGLALWGTARGDGRGALLAGAALGAAVWVHGLLAVLVPGLAAGLLAARGPGLVRDRRFWLGMGALVAVLAPWLAGLWGGAIASPAQPQPPTALLAWAGRLLSDGLPGLLGGKYLALYYAGEARYPIPPLVAWLPPALVPAWPLLGLGRAANRALGLLLVQALVVWLVSALLTGPHNPELRYLFPAGFCCLLWLALLVGLLAARPGWRGRLGLSLAVVLMAAGLSTYGLNCQYVFAQTGGRPPAVYPPYTTGTTHHVDFRPLYRALAGQTRPLTYLGGDTRPLLFHEREDPTGRLGLGELDERAAPAGNLVAEFVYPWSVKQPPAGRPVALGPGVDGKWRGWVAGE